MIVSLTGIGITILSTLEMVESFTELPFSSYSISFLTDDIIRLRYIEVEGHLRKILMVVKMRGGGHSKEIREYEITTDGVVLGEPLSGYDQLITGLPKRASALRTLEG
jgi:circadian clock protein KaiC